MVFDCTDEHFDKFRGPAEKGILFSVPQSSAGCGIHFVLSEVGLTCLFRKFD